MIEEKTLGNKDKFAISYTIEKAESEYIFGTICLWIKNQYIGNCNEIVMLSAIRYQFEMLINRFELISTNEFDYMDSNDIFGVVTSPNSIENDRFTLSLGESFDDFCLRVFKTGDSLVFLWKLYEDAYSQYEGYSREIFYERVPVSEVVNVISAFKDDEIFEGKRNQ